MKKTYIRNQFGITLIELIAGLAIATMIIGLFSTVLVTSFKHEDITQSHVNLRQEANLIVTKLRTLHQGDSYNLCYENGKIYLDSEKTNLLASENITLKGIENSNGQRILIENEGSQITESNADTLSCNNPASINPEKPLFVTLTLVDDNNKEFEIDTVIDRLSAYEDKGTDDTGNPNTESDFSKFVRDERVFLYSNDMEINNQLLINGEQSTVIFKSLSPEKNTANRVEIQAKNIYIKGDVSIKDLILGNSTSSSTYIDGNVIPDKSLQIYGQLKYTGNLTNPSVVTGFAEEVEAITFPTFSIPNLKEKSWYDARDYTSNSTLTNNMKYFGPTISLQNNGNTPPINVIIASKGDIDLKGNFTGILFAPNGTVEINAGSSTFTGIIIANRISIATSVELNFNTATSSGELPF